MTGKDPSLSHFLQVEVAKVGVEVKAEAEGEVEAAIEVESSERCDCVGAVSGK